MAFGQIVLVVYALLMILGGYMGYRSGSAVSLYAGGGSGLLLLVAYIVSRFNFSVGMWIGTVLALLLAVNFGMRWYQTGKAMPAVALMGLSIVAMALMARSVIGYKG